MIIATASAVRHFIYPLSESSGFQFEGGRPITPQNLIPDARRGAVDEWGLATNFRVIAPADWVWAYFGGKVRRIHAVGVVEGPVGYRSDWGRHTVYIRWDAELTRELQVRPLRYEDYRQQVQAAAARANDVTTRALEQWLHPLGHAAGRSSPVSRVSTEVLLRLGQGGFRAEALRAFAGRCAITGTELSSVLQAAHIVPVAAGGSHDVANSLLLRADIHNLFDLGLITVTPRLKVEVANSVDDADYRAVDGAKIQVPHGVDRERFKASLQRHREWWSERSRE